MGFGIPYHCGLEEYLEYRPCVAGFFGRYFSLSIGCDNAELAYLALQIQAREERRTKKATPKRMEDVSQQV
jgi:hypothetical protein